MARYVIKPDKVPQEMRNRDAATRVAVQIGCFRAAVRAQGILKRDSMRAAHDRGTFANAWQVVPPSVTTFARGKLIGRRRVVRVENKAPYAGIIELGARPHGVSLEGRLAIREWVRRNIRVAVWSKAGRSGGQVQTGTRMRSKKDPELDRITQAIVWKIQREGQPPHYIVSKRMYEFIAQLAKMVEREVKRAASKRRPPGGGK